MVGVSLLGVCIYMLNAFSKYTFMRIEAVACDYFYFLNDK